MIIRDPSYSREEERILIHHSDGNLAKGQKLKVQVPNERDSPRHFGTQHHVSTISAYWLFEVARENRSKFDVIPHKGSR